MTGNDSSQRFDSNSGGTIIGVIVVIVCCSVDTYLLFSLMMAYVAVPLVAIGVAAVPFKYGTRESLAYHHKMIDHRIK